ncbi:MAG: DUF2804 domain-containing protein [Actinomycetota bacterium]|nr:DUF2804 domain-containing protein [Actinomycetota bacterium]
MPMVRHGVMRKRWRYIGYYGDEIMLCAAQVMIGPFRNFFWSIWDRETGEVFEHTQIRPGRPEVAMEGNYAELRADGLRASLVLGPADPIEVVCPSGKGWGWTRKRAGVPMAGRVEVKGPDGPRVWQIDGLGVDDESAGYQARHTSWSWSAGIGVATDGRNVGWNLVAGINDPVTGSERAIWIDGIPSEPEPVVFRGLDAVSFGDGGLLDFDFSGGAERERHDNFGLIRSDYVHRFGTFSGQLDGIELESGAGVMEEHQAVW